ESRQDKELPAKLREELPGLLAWAVTGCLDWQHYGLGEPEEVRQATGAYRDEMDLLAQFTAERCVVAPAAMVQSSVLYAACKEWCDANGEHPRSNKWLTSRLLEKGSFSKVSRKSGVWWAGLGLSSTCIDANVDDLDSVRVEG